MFGNVRVALVALTALLSATFVSALGSTCSSPLGAGTAAAGDPYWQQTIARNGLAPYSPNPSSYSVFRNVKSYGAKGDGVTDDTAAINAAISAGSRCGLGCDSSTVTPAVVYFPQGTYVVSGSIIPFYYTQLIGDARHPPTILATSGFNGLAVIDADPYIPGGNGANYWTNQNNFFRAVRNLVIDMRQIPATNQIDGLHWQTSQATNLQNIVVWMSTASNTAHRGMFMENGSGGMMGDLVFNGGYYGMWLGNQQFTVRNVTVNNAVGAGILMDWNWGWTFKNIFINNCPIGFDVVTGGLSIDDQTAGGEVIQDSVITNTPIFVRTSATSSSKLTGSLVLDNVQLNNVPKAVYDVASARTVLNGGTTTIQSWVQGNVYNNAGTSHSYQQAAASAPSKPGVLLDSAGRFFGRSQPQYESYSPSQFVSARAQGAKGDGVTDDTTALNNLFSRYSGCKIIFLDAGVYYVTSTIHIPAGTQLVGEGWSQIVGGGSNFQNVNSPQVVVQVGASGSTGVLEISDIVFSTRGPSPGAIVVEWNAHDPAGSQGVVGAWSSHIRIGSAQGTNLQASNCATTLSPGGNTCYGAFMSLHITSGASAYIEGLWAWVGDHDLDGSHAQVNVYAGRGILSESKGPVWLVGTAAEHHALYNYGLVGAANHYMGLIQVETPYWQPLPSGATTAPSGPGASAQAAGNVSVSVIGQKDAAAHPIKQRRSASLPSGWTAGGCVVDNGNRILQGYSFTSSSMTPSLCASTCASQGFSIAGSEYSSECYCGNSYVGGTPASAPSTDCNMVCSGDSTQDCGAGYRLNIYTSSGGSGGTTPPSSGGNGPFPLNPTYHDPSSVPSSAIGLFVRTSNNILVYGAGLYSFFQQYAKACEDSVNCQNSIVDIDSSTTPIHIYQLTTLGVNDPYLVNGATFGYNQYNIDGWTDTITAWAQ